MIDFHTHTLFSDGELLPSELARRAKDMGYRSICFTDHVDMSNMETVITGVKKAVGGLEKYYGLYVFAGVEITHVPPPLIKEAVEKARSMGAEIVVLHGETITEPVAEGTNKAAIEVGVDILAHPGLITEEDAHLAKEKGVFLEISARKGHCLANGHVWNMAKKTGAKCVINTDAHAPEDLVSRSFAHRVLSGAGMNEKEVEDTFNNAEFLLQKLIERRG
ncbi:MAG: histidinol phosphate phosphatase domain-containing protein [Deltaproteobacteria bacterium]|nr:histidinol phosphate phosphatase domain-containing protein [Deltaproteobacteria bacterium]